MNCVRVNIKNIYDIIYACVLSHQNYIIYIITNDVDILKEFSLSNCKIIRYSDYYSIAKIYLQKLLIENRDIKRIYYDGEFTEDFMNAIIDDCEGIDYSNYNTESYDELNLIKSIKLEITENDVKSELMSKQMPKNVISMMEKDSILGKYFYECDTLTHDNEILCMVNPMMIIMENNQIIFISRLEKITGTRIRIREIGLIELQSTNTNIYYGKLLNKKKKKRYKKYITLWHSGENYNVYNIIMADKVKQFVLFKDNIIVKSDSEYYVHK